MAAATCCSAWPITYTCAGTHWAVTAHLGELQSLIPHRASAGIHWHFFVYVGPTALSSCAQLSSGCLSTISNPIIPSEVRYLCLHQKSNFTPIKSCNNRICNPILRTPFNPACSPDNVIQWGQSQAERDDRNGCVCFFFFFFLFFSHRIKWQNREQWY